MAEHQSKSKGSKPKSKQRAAKKTRPEAEPSQVQNGNGSERQSVAVGSVPKPPKKLRKPRAGDWYCTNPDCVDLVFGYRTACHLCGTPKPGYNPGDPAPMGGKPGDWICPKPSCGDLVFARRMKCNRCGTNKPEHLMAEALIKKPTDPDPAVVVSEERKLSTSLRKKAKVPAKAVEPGREQHEIPGHNPETKKKRRRGKRGGKKLDAEENCESTQVTPQDVTQVESIQESMETPDQVGGYVFGLNSTKELLDVNERSAIVVPAKTEAVMEKLSLNANDTTATTSKVFMHVLETSTIHGPYTPSQLFSSNENTKTAVIAFVQSNVRHSTVSTARDRIGLLSENDTLDLCERLGANLDASADEVEEQMGEMNISKGHTSQIQNITSGDGSTSLSMGASGVDLGLWGQQQQQQFPIFLDNELDRSKLQNIPLSPLPPRVSLQLPTPPGLVHMPSSGLNKTAKAVLTTTGYNRVTVCHMEGNYLWVHEFTQSTGLAELEVSMAYTYSQALLKIPKDSVYDENTIFAAPYTTINEDHTESVTWTRVGIIDKLENELVLVSHIDYGSTDTMNFDDLRMLSAEFTGLPSQAIKCKLNILTEFNLKEPSSAVKCQWLADQLNGQQLLCTVVASESSTGASVVDLFDVKCNSLMPWIDMVVKSQTDAAAGDETHSVS